MTQENSTYGTITKSYQFAMDGEFSSGYNELDVIVTEYWKTGELKNTAKEVKTPNGTYYRCTKQNGWRQYNKESKSFRENRYTGTYISFIPGTTANKDNRWNKVNLGSW
jgi:hypothetical protein